MRKTVFLILFLLSLSANAQIVINELLAKNVSWNMDEGFNFSNWVELYNPSTTIGFNQTNYYLTDNLSNPTKWKPTSKIIPAKSFSILYFERDEIAGHATFKLSPEGGVLYLLNASLTVIDSVLYPDQLRNISWGRKTDNATEWGFIDEPTPGFTNNNRTFTAVRCNNPTFILPGGFYATAQQVRLSCDLGDTIYYTTNYTEPTRNSTLYVNPITLSVRSVLRAKVFKKGKLSSDVITATYFINQRETHLPIVSVVTNPTYLFDPKIGIYVNGDGTNGKMGNGASSPMNWNADWDRPVNYEFYDTTHTARLNQELDIKILGGWTKANPLKSIAIMPKKKFGNNKLKYEVFAATKLGMKYHDIQMRNSGNDFYYSMMRDAFMQSIVQKRLNLDYEAYEPAVIFMNGVYYGIENLRERTNESFVYSNYGIDEDDVYEIEATNININTENDIATDTAFSVFSSYLKNNDITSGAIYQRVGQMMDIDNFISYNIADIFFGNTDWPYNNCKMWRKKVNGIWRWFLTDTDFGFNLWDTSPQTHNTLTFALGENQVGNISGYAIQPEWSTIVLSRLMTNEQFKNHFIDKFAIHLSTTFATARIDHIMDSLALKISNEIVYHKNKYGSSRTLAADVINMKTFSANRANNMLNFVSSRLVNSAAIVNIALSSNLSRASYTLNSELIQDPNLTLRYFQGRDYFLKANTVPGYKFKQWEKAGASGSATISTAPIYSGNLTSALNLKAVYEVDNTPVNYTVVINELVSSNNIVSDEMGDKDDYIELYNYGNQDIDIAGWYLTDNTNDRMKATIPTLAGGKTNLPAQGRLVFWADDQAAQGPLHLPFKLSKEGDTVILSRPAAKPILVDSVYYPLLAQNLSYSRLPDGGQIWKIQGMTCNLNNSLGTALPIVQKTVEIYPTLVTDWFTVKNANGEKLMIFDLTGKCVYQTVCSSDEQFIQGDFLKSGLYLLRVGNRNSKIMKR